MLLKGNCLETLKTLETASVDSIVTDPPYELGFMGKSWDNSGIAYNAELWAECLRVLKPGGHLLAFSGSRTYHRMVVAIEDSGFEIRDQIMYLYGSGFPKSLNVQKAAKDKVCQCEVEWSYGTGEPQTKHSMRNVSEQDVPQAEPTETGARSVLLKGVSKQGAPVAGWSEPSTAEVRAGQPSMEGRSDTQAPEGELQGCEVCSLPEGVSADGSQRRVHHGTPAGDGSMGGPDVGSERSGEPHQPRPLGQSQRELGTVPEQRRPQEGGSWSLCERCGKPMVSGWGTALKPAHEPIVVARKPLIGTVASNVLTYGTGALNIDGSRVGIAEGDEPSAGKRTATFGTQETISGGDGSGGWEPSSGRWPANVIHDGSDEVLAGFPITGPAKSGKRNPNGKKQTNAFGDYGGQPDAIGGHDDNGGSAARFFYCAKASKSERNAGLDDFEAIQTTGGGGLTAETREDGSLETASAGGKYGSIKAKQQNFHPTVKPLALMRYLIKLVTPPNGTVLDPFLGSGTTAVAATLEGFEWIGCEMTEDYWPIIEARVEWAKGERTTTLF